jgi:DNA modification methylase
MNDTKNIQLNNLFNGNEDYFFVTGDCLEILKNIPDESIDCIITSPPYWKQRQYHHDGNPSIVPLGDEAYYQDYIKNLVTRFSQLKRVLKKEGSFWLNLGDKYHNKNLMGIPWRVAIAMQDDGWILRNDIIWDQMKGTQSAKDRLRDIYEHIFHFVKQKTYYYADHEIRIAPPTRAKNKNGTMISATGVSGKKYFEQIKMSTTLTEIEKKNALQALEETIEEMKRGEIVDFRMTIRGCQRTFHSDNKIVSGRAKELEIKGFYILKMRSNGYLPSDIWRIVPEDKWRKDTHYAVFPEELLINPIRATCPVNGIVLDPFSGTGSTVSAALNLGRKAIGIEISSDYNEFAKERIKETIQKMPSLF